MHRSDWDVGVNVVVDVVNIVVDNIIIDWSIVWVGYFGRIDGIKSGTMVDKMNRIYTRKKAPFLCTCMNLGSQCCCITCHKSNYLKLIVKF